jgi:hypothetical protein
LRTIISEAQFKPFEPQTVEAMNEAFKAAWHSIETSGIKLDGHVDLVRERIALRIIEKAQAGERNMIALRDDAIAFAMKTDASPACDRTSGQSQR